MIAPLLKEDFETRHAKVVAEIERLDQVDQSSLTLEHRNALIVHLFEAKKYRRKAETAFYQDKGDMADVYLGQAESSIGICQDAIK